MRLGLKTMCFKQESESSLRAADFPVKSPQSVGSPARSERAAKGALP